MPYRININIHVCLKILEFSGIMLGGILCHAKTINKASKIIGKLFIDIVKPLKAIEACIHYRYRSITIILLFINYIFFLLKFSYKSSTKMEKSHMYL